VWFEIIWINVQEELESAVLAEAEVSEEMHSLEIRLAELLDLKTVSDEAYRSAVFPPPLCRVIFLLLIFIIRGLRHNPSSVLLYNHS
jgi:hypothetical protein